MNNSNIFNSKSDLKLHKNLRIIIKNIKIQNLSEPSETRKWKASLLAIKLQYVLEKTNMIRKKALYQSYSTVLRTSSKTSKMKREN